MENCFGSCDLVEYVVEVKIWNEMFGITILVDREIEMDGKT